MSIATFRLAREEEEAKLKTADAVVPEAEDKIVVCETSLAGAAEVVEEPQKASVSTAKSKTTSVKS